MTLTETYMHFIYMDSRKKYPKSKLGVWGLRGDNRREGGRKGEECRKIYSLIKANEKIRTKNSTSKHQKRTNEKPQTKKQKNNHENATWQYTD